MKNVSEILELRRMNNSYIKERRDKGEAVCHIIEKVSADIERHLTNANAPSSFTERLGYVKLRSRSTDEWAVIYNQQTVSIIVDDLKKGIEETYSELFIALHQNGYVYKIDLQCCEGNEYFIWLKVSLPKQKKNGFLKRLYKYFS